MTRPANASMKPAETWEVDVRSDLFNAGYHPEDGSELVGESYYLIARNERGEQFVHFHTFSGVYRNELTAAREGAARLLVKVQHAQRATKWSSPRNNIHWREVDPAYGSEAYAADSVALAYKTDLLDARAAGEEFEFHEFSRSNWRGVEAM